MTSEKDQADQSNITVDALPRITGPSSCMSLTPSVNDELISLQESQLASLGSSVNLLNQRALSSSVNATLIQHTPIQIIGGKGHHVGNTHVHHFQFNVGKTKNGKEKNKKIAKDVLIALQKSVEPVTSAHVKKVRIGKKWRMVMRHLEISDPDIDNHYEQYFHNGGIEEVIYQLLRLWIESNGSDATLNKLSTALWAENQIDALNTLAQAFHIIPPPPKET